MGVKGHGSWWEGGGGGLPFPTWSSLRVLGSLDGDIHHPVLSGGGAETKAPQIEGYQEIAKDVSLLGAGNRLKGYEGRRGGD